MKLRIEMVTAASRTSLWSVDDAATAELMKQFYSQLNAGVGRAEALRQAQLSMLQGPYKQPVY
jgi:CHAT domain-containing protein